MTATTKAGRKLRRYGQGTLVQAPAGRTATVLAQRGTAVRVALENGSYRSSRAHEFMTLEPLT